MNEDRISIYVEQLNDLNERQIQFAFVRALRECRFIPQIAELREFAEQWRPAVIDDARRILERGDKPADYVSQCEAKAFIEQLRAMKQ